MSRKKPGNVEPLVVTVKRPSLSTLAGMEILDDGTSAEDTSTCAPALKLLPVTCQCDVENDADVRSLTYSSIYPLLRTKTNGTGLA